jgi:hypothetical protein
VAHKPILHLSLLEHIEEADQQIDRDARAHGDAVESDVLFLVDSPHHHTGLDQA